MKQCPDCGENLADDAVHCGHCGTKVEEEEGDGGKTMFGMGALTDEDLEKVAAEEEGAEGSGDDDSDGGFRLPRPSEMDEGSSEQDDQESSGESDEAGRLGLKGPAAEDDPEAYADTEALPSLEEKSNKQQDASDDLKGGRLSTPSPDQEEGAKLGGSPDLSGDSSPPSDEGSPFADGDNQPQATDQQSGSADATAGPSEPAAPGADTSGARAESDEVSGDGATQEMPETADMIAPPEDDEPSPARAPESSADETAAEQPSSKAADATSSESNEAPERSPSKPAVESEDLEEATAERSEEAPSRNPLSEDGRFGDGSEDSGGAMQQEATGSEVGEQELDMEKPRSSADSGSNQKTIMIVLGILLVSGFVCAVGAVAIFWFDLI